ncbi:MAG: hypothetical protein KC535_03920 [Nanoarchaeota archaeon]|nr:hypothetical protein [Nanoarchaeota archaeon]
MDEDIFLAMGLTESEKKVYLSLLDLGDSTRSKIVDASGIAGSKVYEILEKLCQKGFISTYVKNKVKHFKPLHPHQILNYLDSKKEELSFLQQKAELMLPSLLAKFNSSKESQEVELVTGLKGLEIIFREQLELMNEGETCYVIGGTKGHDEDALSSFFEKVHRRRDDKKIKTNMLFNKKQKEEVQHTYASKNYSWTTTRYIDHTSPVAINVYQNKTIIIIFGRAITSIYITSQEVANSFLEYFTLLWNQALR